jgi:hypothetical protein
MKIATDIRHMTPAGGNVFLDLGFPPEEATRLQAASRKEISSIRSRKDPRSAERVETPTKHQRKPS